MDIPLLFHSFMNNEVLFVAFFFHAHECHLDVIVFYHCIAHLQPDGYDIHSAVFRTILEGVRTLYIWMTDLYHFISNDLYVFFKEFNPYECLEDGRDSLAGH
jgi:hypothetical protein